MMRFDFKTNNGLEISDQKTGAVLKIEPPIYIENGEEKSLAFSEMRGDSYIYSDSKNEVCLSVEKTSDSLFYIKRKWANTSCESRNIQTVFRTSSCFDVKKYLIPCVNFNGNEFGAGNEPKGLSKDGSKWIFAYDRESIPSCTVTENEDFACALFASAESAVSLQSSCSIFKDSDGVFHQEIFHPIIEAPLTYSARDSYAPPARNFHNPFAR